VDETHVVRRYAEYLQTARQPNGQVRFQDPVQYCLYHGIELFFSALVIRGGGPGEEYALPTELFHALKAPTKR
jgi:hypothetical protein